jgi:hypothetical protein
MPAQVKPAQVKPAQVQPAQAEPAQAQLAIAVQPAQEQTNAEDELGNNDNRAASSIARLLVTHTANLLASYFGLKLFIYKK